MKKTTSKALASAALTALIAGIIPVGQVSAAANTEFERLSGKDRYLTAVEVSKAGWANGSDCAVVANGEAYADALSAGPFAKKNNAPILLTSSKGITNETVNELKRLKVKKVYVIGETGVVPNSILEAIKKNVTTDVERIGGADRYATSIKIAEKLGTVTEAMLASGEGYADALSAVPVAAVKGVPIILTKAGELPKVTSDYIKAQGIKKTYVIGGTASVSDKVKGLVPNAVRLGGKNRFETNSEIIKSFALDFNFDEAYVALANGVTGKEFADALTASAIAAKGGHPVIISSKTADAATTALIEEKLSPTAKITAIGGTANLSDALINSYKVKGETIEASKNVTGNAVVVKDNLELKDMKVTGNLYLEGNNITLNNVTVNGTIFINPGKDGTVTLNNVTAAKAVVLSGADKSIHFNKVTLSILFISSKTSTRIVNDGPVDIKNVEIFSDVILDAQNPFTGTITVVGNLYEKDLQFLGNFEGTITLKGDDKVLLNGQMATVEIQGATLVKTAEGTKVVIKITTEKAKEGSKIDVPAGSGVKVEGAKEGNVTGDGAGDATKPGDTGNTGGGSTGGTTEHKYTLKMEGNNLDYSINLGANDNLEDVYDKIVKSMKSGDTAYEAAISVTNLAIDKMNNTTANGVSVRQYIANKLLAKNAQSVIGKILSNANPDSGDIVNYFKGKTFDEAYDLLNKKSGGTITIPELMGEARTVENIAITVDGETTEISGEANISQILGIVGVNPSKTKLSEIKNKEFTIKVNFDSGSPYTITSEDGKLTLELKNTYTITLK